VASGAAPIPTQTSAAIAEAPGAAGAAAGAARAHPAAGSEAVEAMPRAPMPHAAVHATPASALRLAELAPGRRARILRVTPPPARPEWARLLADIGFEAGEPVQVLRRAALGGDPIVVRIGASTFALRRAEADCVEVELAA
jgi:ferrous iron transport protein A